MPGFRSKEEYEQWKAQRIQELEAKKTEETPKRREEVPHQAPTSRTLRSRESKAKESPLKQPLALEPLSLEMPPIDDISFEPLSLEPPSTEPPAIKPPGKPPRPRRRRGVSQNLSGIGDLFRKSWEIYRSRIGALLPVYLLSIVIFLAAFGVGLGTSVVVGLFAQSLRGPVIVLGALAGFIAAMVAFFWALAALTFAVVDEGIGIREAFGKGWERIMAFAWLYVLSGFIITGGYLLLIIPGLIFLVWFGFGQFILAEEDQRGMQALLKSKEYVRGQWFGVFWRLLVVWLVSAGLGVIPFIGPLLSLLFVPFVMIYMYLLYNDLKASNREPVYSVSAGAKLKWVGAGALGYVAVPVLAVFLFGASLAVPLMILQGMVNAKMKGASFSSSKASPGEFNFTSMPPGSKSLGQKGSGQGMVPATPGPQGQSSHGANPQDPTQFSGLSKTDESRPEATGEAVIVRDGIRETFVLKTGFFSDTRLADATRAEVQYQFPGEQDGNARRIEMRLDATKVGRHFVDGELVSKTWIDRSSLKIGEETPKGRIASFYFIADGGQVFFPKENCTITVTSPYTGTPDSTFAGEVSECVVHSAGIDQKISSVTFVMKGPSSR